MVNTRTNMAGGPRKCVSFFFELIPKLAYEKNGTTKFHIKTKEHLCWWLQRLLGWNQYFVHCACARAARTAHAKVIASEISLND